MLRSFAEDRGVIVVQPQDTFLYTCHRCGDCCRNVRESIFVSSLDAYRLARHLGVTMQALIHTYMVRVPIGPFDFPILMLRAKAHMDACTFLQKGSCRAQPSKPLVCKLYPLNINPDSKYGLSYAIVSKKPHHFVGDPIVVDDWMRENLSPEDRHFMQGWYDLLETVRDRLKPLSKNQGGVERVNEVCNRIFQLIYMQIDPALEFWPQYEANTALLRKELDAAGK